MANRYWVGGSGTWDASDTTNWSATSGGAGGASAPTAADAAIFDAASGVGTVTIITGATCLSMNASVFTGTFAFGTNKIAIDGVGTVFIGGTGYTVSGAPLIEFTNNSATARTITAGAATEANSISFNILAGTGSLTLSGSVRDLDLTGFSGNLTLSNRTVYGNLTFSNTMTTSAGSGGETTFAATSGVKLVNFNGVVVGGSVSFNGVGGAWKLVGNTTLDSTRTVSLINGTLDLDDNNLTCGLFNSSNSNARTLAFGNGGSITVNNTSGNVIWSTSTATNLSVTGTAVVNVSANTSITKSIVAGSLNEINAISFNFTTGTYTLNFIASGHSAKNVDFTGFSGTWTTSSTPIVYGNITLSATMTIPASTAILTCGATSGPKIITTNGLTVDFPLNFNGIGGSWNFQDALTLGATRAMTLTNGTVRLKDGVTSTVGSLATSGTNQKFLESTLAGTQATLSDASGTNSVSNLTIKDINATGGATWNAFVTNGNVDDGNNTGWDFFAQIGRYMYNVRKSKRLLI